MSTPQYRSDTAVSVRVDQAWQRGYEAGKSEARRLAGVMMVAEVFVVLRQKRVPVLPILAVLAVLSLYLVPALMASSAIGTGLAYRRRHANRTRGTVTSTTVPGNTAAGWGPF